MIEVDDDFEEANLSDLDEAGSGTPTKNDCGRYSDLRGSASGSAQRKKELDENSDRASAAGSQRGGTFSEKVRGKEMGSLRKGMGSEIGDKVSIKVFEPSDKSPACNAEITPKSSAMRRGSARKLIVA